jgi:L-rhamnose mutarotase
MIRREVVLVELDPGAVSEYRKLHRSVWPELEEIYRQAGYQEMSCFLNGTWVIIYMSYDAEKLAQRREWLNTHEVQQNWQAVMQRFKAKTIESFEEIYRLSRIGNLNPV